MHAHIVYKLIVARACRGQLACLCVHMHMCDGMRVSVHSYITGRNKALEHTCVRVAVYRVDENTKNARGAKVFFFSKGTKVFYHMSVAIS